MGIDPLKPGRLGVVEQALTKASQSTGVAFDYLMKTAKRESALNPGAKAATSSAAGLFQFVEQTWLGTLKKHGAKHGLGGYSDQIFKDQDGRWQVRDGNRAQIMNLRYDPTASAAMAAEMTASHADYLRDRTGKDPSGGDLYIAHFLGPAGAASLLEAVKEAPHQAANRLFPAAANANRSIFYTDGRAASVSEVYANLVRHAGDGAVVTPVEDDIYNGLDPVKMQAMAERLNRLKHEENMLKLMGGQSTASTLLQAQLLSAFGPERSGNST